MINFLLFDIPPVESSVGIGVFSLIAVIILLTLGFIGFIMIRKTIKMAIRMAIVAVVLIVALVGSVAFYMLSSSNQGTTKSRPNAVKPTK